MLHYFIFLFLIKASCVTLNEKLFQPFGPLLCESKCQTQKCCTDHEFDEVHLACKIVLITFISNISCSATCELNLNLCALSNRSRSAKNDMATLSENTATHRKSAEKTIPKEKLCPAGRVNKLLVACRKGNYGTINKLVSRGMVGVNCYGYIGTTAVMEAVMLGKREIFDFLVHHGCNMSAVDVNGNTLLHLACYCKCGLYFLKTLLDDHKLDIDSKGQFGMTPLMTTIEVTNLKAFKFLQKRGADLKAKTEKNETILHLLSYKFYFHKETEKYVVSLNVPDIESRDKDGQTPLMCAVKTGKKTVVKLLMDKRADIHTMDNRNNNIIHAACIEGKVSMVKYVLSLHIAEIDCRGYFGRTPLMFAVKECHFSVVKLLKRKGADVKAVDDSNNSMLHMACVCGDLQLVRYLISLKVFDVDRRGRSGRTPLMISAENGPKPVLRLLHRKYKAKISTIDDDGLTVLHIACQAGQLHMVKYLVNLKGLRGMEKMKTKAGDTPLNLARKEGHLAIVSFLKKRE